MRVDGAPVERLIDSPHRPLVSVFLPDRLELIKGVPALRRAHLDQFVSALWPARSGTRRAYAQALAQRNALIARVGASGSSGVTGRGTPPDAGGLVPAPRHLHVTGSHGQQRLGLLALLLAEREVIGELRSGPPLMLLDDVMSELDLTRRQALVRVLSETGGQA